MASLVVNAVFIAYFGRPAAFAISAARWSGADLAVEPIDLDYAPPLTVLVACHNEEAWSDRWSPPLSRLEHDRRTFSGPRSPPSGWPMPSTSS